MPQLGHLDCSSVTEVEDVEDHQTGAGCEEVIERDRFLEGPAQPELRGSVANLERRHAGDAIGTEAGVAPGSGGGS